MFWEWNEFLLVLNFKEACVANLYKIYYMKYVLENKNLGVVVPSVLETLQLERFNHFGFVLITTKSRVKNVLKLGIPSYY